MGLTQSSNAPEGGAEGYHVHGVNYFIFPALGFDIEQLCSLAILSVIAKTNLSLENKCRLCVDKCFTFYIG